MNAVAQFTPIAQYQARVAVEDMFGEDAPAADYSVLPTAIFTDPELAGVGLTEEQAREEGYDFEAVTNEYVRRFSYIDAKHGLFKSSSTERIGACSACTSSPGARATSSRVLAGPTPGRDRGRPGGNAPRLPHLRRGSQGGGERATAAAVPAWTRSVMG